MNDLQKPDTQKQWESELKRARDEEDAIWETRIESIYQKDLKVMEEIATERDVFEMVLDDDIPDAFDNWLLSLDPLVLLQLYIKQLKKING